MSWLSNHALNAILTGASQLDYLHRHAHEEDFCQSRCCLNTLLRDQDGWGGVFAVDELPKSPPPANTNFIVNSAPASSSGQHWLAVRVLEKEIEFFDSYGMPPWKYPMLYTWLKKQQKERIHYLNRQRIQGPRAYCGAYCFYFLCERPFHATFYDTLFNNPRFIFTSLDANTKDAVLIKTYLSLNDSVVFDYLYRHTQRLLSIYDDKKK